MSGYRVDVRNFLIGSSYPIIFFPLVYLGVNAASKGVTHLREIPYPHITALLPLVYGLLNVVGERFFTEVVPIADVVTRAIMVGAIGGLVLSLIGRFYLKIPAVLFEMPEEEQWMVHVVAILLYSVVFGVATPWLNELLS